jgi:hypothetical protein
MADLDASKLTNYQLYALIQNVNLDEAITALATAELDRRKLSETDKADLASKHQLRFRVDKGESLSINNRLLLLAFPFLMSKIFPGKYLAQGQKQQWKDYWLYMMGGYLVWTIGIIAFCRFILFRHSN